MHKGATEKALQPLLNYVTSVAVTQTDCAWKGLPFPQMW